MPVYNAPDLEHSRTQYRTLLILVVFFYARFHKQLCEAQHDMLMSTLVTAELYELFLKRTDEPFKDAKTNRVVINRE